MGNCVKSTACAKILWLAKTAAEVKENQPALALLFAIQPAIQVEVVVDISGEDFGDFRIFSAACNNHISILLVVADVLVKHGLDSRHVLRGDVVDLATALIDVSLNASEQSDIRFNVHIELEIHHGTKAGIIESVNTFHDDDIMRFKIFAGQIGAAVMRIIITLLRNTLTFQQAVHIRKQQVMVENGRLIVVQQAAFFKAQVRMVFIVGILIDDEDAFVDHGCKFFCQGGFSAAACAANANKQHRLVVLLCYMQICLYGFVRD